MSTTDCSPRDAIARWEEQVRAGLAEAVAMACPAQPRLHDALTQIVSTYANGCARSPRRLFALAVLAAITGEPVPALPVAVVTNLWWAGAEALDDLMDGASAAPGELSPAAALTASIACMTVVPQAYLASPGIPDGLRLTWMAETTRSSLGAAEGQLADLARGPAALTWPHVMATYVGKTGAAYERDAVMAAQLATDDATTLRGWRAFGQLFGVLRQAHNDNTGDDPCDDEDLANGTPTLLLAYALEVLAPAERAEALALHTAGTTDPMARVKLHAVLRRPDILAGYQDRLAGLRRKACALLTHLTGGSDFTCILQSWIDCSYTMAVPDCGEAAANPAS